MANKPNILATFKAGQSLGAVDHYMETMNWLVGFVSNLKSDTGIEIKNPTSDHPSIKANIIAGDGIKVEESSGAWKISLDNGDDGDGDGDDDGDGDGGGSKGKQTGGGSGSGSGGAGSGGGSGGSGGSSGGAGGGAGGSSGGSGSGSGGGGKGSSCNEFSADIENDNDDGGMDNPGDNCAELNGW